MRGKFRIYLGAAPGVGKTYAMHLAHNPWLRYSQWIWG
jgi:K+-sensing histidine kinase KdpD